VVCTTQNPRKSVPFVKRAGTLLPVLKCLPLHVVRDKHYTFPVIGMLFAITTLIWNGQYSNEHVVITYTYKIYTKKNVVCYRKGITGRVMLYGRKHALYKSIAKLAYTYTVSILHF
jgi:hypothetical protein